MPSSTTITPTLEQIIAPLLDLLNRRYPVCEDAEYLAPERDPFEADDFDDDVIAIELPDDIAGHDLAERAIATLLQATGSEAAWVCGQNPEDNPLGRPLRFSLIKRTAWAGYFWAGGRYLVVDFLGDDFDAEAATQQVGLLVGLLEDPNNLIALTAEERALLF